MKKFFIKLQLKYEGSLVKKNMVMKQEIKRLKKVLEETRIENHRLIDEITLKNIKIRELALNERLDRK